MDRRQLLKIAMATGAWALLGNTARAKGATPADPIYLGKFTGFYRGTQLQGHLLSSKQ
jgi:hypothetical protein